MVFDYNMFQLASNFFRQQGSKPLLAIILWFLFAVLREVLRHKRALEIKREDNRHAELQLREQLQHELQVKQMEMKNIEAQK